MATGDLNNNIDKARNELTSIKYDGVWNSIGIAEGSPEAYLPLIHHVCVNFSRFLARFLASKGYELVGKSDMRFVEEVYKILRNEFNYRPALNVQQFFTVGFAERKLILVCDLIKLCKRKHNEISKQKADARRKAVSSPSASLLRPPSPQVNTSLDNSLRKSGGSLSKSGTTNLDGSQRRTSTGASPTVPKKFVASTSLVNNNEMDVVDFRPNVSAARPPIRVIRNESKSEMPINFNTTPTHPNSFSAFPPSTPPAPTANGPTYQPMSQPHTPYSSSFTSPSHPPSSSFTSPAHPSAPSSVSTYPPNPPHSSYPNAPLPSSSTFASRNADGAWRVQEGHAGLKNIIRDEGMIVEDVEEESDEEEDSNEQEEEDDEVKNAREDFTHMNGRVEDRNEKTEVRMNGKVDAGKVEVKYSPYLGSSVGVGNGRDAMGSDTSGGQITDRSALYILDKLAQMEARVMASISNLQTSVVSLESRVKNVESMLSDNSKRAVYQSPQQPALSNNPNKQSINSNTDYKTSSVSSFNYPSPPTNYPPSQPQQHNPQSHPTSHTTPNRGQPTTENAYGSKYQVHKNTDTSNYNNYPPHTNHNNYSHYSNNNNIPSGNPNDTSGSNLSDNGSTGSGEKERLAYKSTPQSTHDFISSITKRFQDTRELLSKQHPSSSSFSSFSLEQK